VILLVLVVDLALQFTNVITSRGAFHGLACCSHGPMGRFPNASTTTPKLTGHRPVATNTHLIGYAAFFSPDSAPRIFFIHAEKRWRFCSRRTTASLITQLN